MLVLPVLFFLFSLVSIVPSVSGQHSVSFTPSELARIHRQQSQHRENSIGYYQIDSHSVSNQHEDINFQPNTHQVQQRRGEIEIRAGRTGEETFVNRIALGTIDTDDDEAASLLSVSTESALSSDAHTHPRSSPHLKSAQVPPFHFPPYPQFPSTAHRFPFSYTNAKSDEKLVFSDDFSEFDLEKWQHELNMGGGGNWEFSYYTNNRSNSYVRDSSLFLRPTLTSDFIGDANLHSDYTMDMWGSAPADQCTGNAFYGCSRTAGGGGNILNPIQSARVRTAESFSFQYGRVEVSARLPCGDWLWPAIWLMPRYNSYGQWPASGEIDIVESRGNLPPYQSNGKGGCNSFGSTIHWGPNWLTDPWNLTHAEYTIPQGTLHDAFHVYGFKWTPTGLFTYVDTEDNKILSVTFSDSFWDRGNFSSLYPSPSSNPWAGRSNSAPFDQKFYLIFNVAVGGTNDYFPDGVGGKSWNCKDPNAVNAFWKAKDQWMNTWRGENVAMEIDWVKVYQ